MLQLLLAVSIAEEPVVANTVEPTGQNVEQKSLDGLVRREGHGFLLIVVAVVSPFKLYLATFDVDDPMIRNGHPVGVAADIVHHLLWPGESRLTPEGRIRSEPSGRVLSQERHGGLHHRYNRAA